MNFVFDYIGALAGGALIGLSATLMLGLHGRIAGISGLLANTIFPETPYSERLWRLVFLSGLVVAGLILGPLMPAQFGTVQGSTYELIGAGLLVGFGTRLGSGCTSGHGVCGLSRLSPRSLAATLTFVAFAILAARTVGASE